ncbi:Ger(x)C family spore germination protein [Paenibacillus sonchi]|uniref:Ger(X)C family spore germination protein n=1 Tax=Paenibacillus sonchi TaxID=373687 RepID=A0A974PE87_9BACL|nr:Ger(x)C family spore germination protein [Paenibacillus sonchi]QQZ61838.1 Ger(x)C family spore germination protein [Paenibacillus sonchi]
MKLGTIALSVLIIFSSLSLTGCWDREYLKDLHLAYGVALDIANDGRIQETVELIIPPEIEQKGTTSEIHTSYGLNLRSASNQMRNRVRGNIRFLKNGFQLIGKSAAEQGLYSNLDVNFRDPSNPTSNVRVIIAEGKASDMLEQKTVGELKVGEFITQKIESLEDMSVFPKETLDTVFRYLKDPGQDFALPYIAVEADEIITRGLALFNDQYYCGMLNPDQSTLLVLLKGQKGKNARFTKKIDLGYPDNRQEYITINVGLKKVKRKFKVSVSADKSIEVHLELKLQAIVEEFPGELSLKEKDFQKVNQALSEILTKEAEWVVEEVQKANCDIFGVGRKLIAYHHNVWKDKNWSKDYRKVHFHPKVDVKIIDTGIIE